jgi:hypothetical protein
MKWMVVNELHSLWMKHEISWTKFIQDDDDDGDDNDECW